MKRIIAIGGSHAETVAFARQIDEKNLRYVTNRDFIKGLRPDELHLLPGYFTRRDRHAVGAEVKVMERKNRQLIVTTWVKVQGSFVEALDVNNLDVEVTPPPVEDIVDLGRSLSITNAFDEIELPFVEPVIIDEPVEVKAPAKPKTSPTKRKPAAKTPPAKRKAPAKKPVMDQPEIDFDTVRNDLTQDVPTVSNVLDTPSEPDPGSDFFDFLDGK